MKFFLKNRIAAAVRDRDLKALDRLLEGEDVNMSLDQDNWNALHMAARRGLEDVVAHLLKKGARVDHRDLQDWTALHHAAHYGRFGVVVELLKAGADPNLRTVEGRTAYGWANLGKHREVAEILSPYMKKLSELVDLPAPPARETPPDASEWARLSGEKIARITTESAIGYKITEIFNFAAQERTTLYHNLETGAESVETRAFDRIAGKAGLEEALAELQRRGGASGVSAIGGLDKRRLAP